jgi:hypothetical protein
MRYGIEQGIVTSKGNNLDEGFPASSPNYGERSSDLDLLYRGDKRDAGARRVSRLYGGTGSRGSDATDHATVAWCDY